MLQPIDFDTPVNDVTKIIGPFSGNLQVSEQIPWERDTREEEMITENFGDPIMEEAPNGSDNLRYSEDTEEG